MNSAMGPQIMANSNSRSRISCDNEQKIGSNWIAAN